MVKSCLKGLAEVRICMQVVKNIEWVEMRTTYLETVFRAVSLLEFLTEILNVRVFET